MDSNLTDSFDPSQATQIGYGVQSKFFKFLVGRILNVAQSIKEKYFATLSPHKLIDNIKFIDSLLMAT